MNTAAAPAWLPSPVVPFVTLSYPTALPAHPDAFADWGFYDHGRLDICFLVGCIVTFALLRDVFRLGVFEPLARWKLTRDLRLASARRSHANGNGAAHANGEVTAHANGNGKLDSLTDGVADIVANQLNHSAGAIAVKESPATSRKELRTLKRQVTRFAEQGWLLVYYTFSLSLGIVSFHAAVPRG
jgi:acyl-CoA-dependent ceramide synthase